PDVPSCTWPAIMHNISEGGFAFWSKRQLRQDGSVYVREFSADNSAPWLPACVTHCTVGIKGYLIGAAFDPPPT
ncbi:MAG: PilZ domain-containing protein, partial [Phycisphaerae bacterium]